MEGTLRVVALSDRWRLSARATLFPKGECDHALPPHFADQPLASGKVGPEHSRSPLCREGGVTRVKQLQAASRTCLLQTAPAHVCLGAPLMPWRLSN